MHHNDRTPNPGQSSPRRPDLSPADILAALSLLGHRERRRQGRLSPITRLRGAA